MDMNINKAQLFLFLLPLTLTGCYDFDLQSREYPCERNQICLEDEVCFEGICQQRRSSVNAPITRLDLYTTADAARHCKTAQHVMVSKMSNQARCALTGIESIEGCGLGSQICTQGEIPQGTPEFLCDYIHSFVDCPTTLTSGNLTSCLEQIIDDVLVQLEKPDICALSYSPPERFANLPQCRSLELVCFDELYSRCELINNSPEIDECIEDPNRICVQPSSQCATGFCGRISNADARCTMLCDSASDCPTGGLCRQVGTSSESYCTPW